MREETPAIACALDGTTMADRLNRIKIVWLTILSSGRSRSDYLEPERAEAFNKGAAASPPRC
jgi:hypothetical protein